MTMKYYPALHLGDFGDAHSALACVGITGALADLFASGMDDEPGAPVAYETEIVDFGVGARTVLVLAPTEEGVVRLCYGYLDLVANTESDALMRAVDGLAEHLTADSLDEAPTLYAFALKPPRRTLQ